MRIRTRRTRRGGLAPLLVGLVLAAATDAGADPPRVGFGGSLGFLVDHPTAFQATLELPIELLQGFEIGPWVSLGFADDYTRVSATANVRYRMSFDNPRVRRFHPLIQGGIGFSYLDHHRIDEASFLANVGPGVEWDISEQLALTSDVMFNFAPSLPGSHDFYFSWQVLGLRVRF